VREAIVQALHAHVRGQRPRVARKTGNDNAHVRVNLEDLVLVRGQLVVRALQAKENGVRLGNQAQSRAALLHGFASVLDLKQLALWRPRRDVLIVRAAVHDDWRAIEFT
jgi:hypothetical protein